MFLAIDDNKSRKLKFNEFLVELCFQLSQWDKAYWYDNDQNMNLAIEFEQRLEVGNEKWIITDLTENQYRQLFDLVYYRYSEKCQNIEVESVEVKYRQIEVY